MCTIVSTMVAHQCTVYFHTCISVHLVHRGKNDCCLLVVARFTFVLTTNKPRAVNTKSYDFWQVTHSLDRFSYSHPASSDWPWFPVTDFTALHVFIYGTQRAQKVIMSIISWDCNSLHPRAEAHIYYHGYQMILHNVYTDRLGQCGSQLFLPYQMGSSIHSID